MNEAQTAQLLSDISEIKLDVRQISSQLKIVDKRLSLIEQRLENIEPWISTDNQHQNLKDKLSPRKSRISPGNF